MLRGVLLLRVVLLLKELLLLPAALLLALLLLLEQLPARDGALAGNDGAVEAAGDDSGQKPAVAGERGGGRGEMAAGAVLAPWEWRMEGSGEKMERLHEDGCSFPWSTKRESESERGEGKKGASVSQHGCNIRGTQSGARAAACSHERTEGAEEQKGAAAAVSKREKHER